MGIVTGIPSAGISGVSEEAGSLGLDCFRGFDLRLGFSAAARIERWWIGRRVGIEREKEKGIELELEKEKGKHEGFFERRPLETIEDMV